MRLRSFIFITTLIIQSLGPFSIIGNPLPDQTVSEIPFSVEKGHIIVPATIKRGTPVEVVLSTGIERSLINFTLLQKYELQASYAGVGIITGHLDQVEYFVAVSDVKVGDASGRTLNMKFGGGALGEISQRVGREIFGIVGMDFFRGRRVQFDFRRKVLRFLRESPVKNAQSVDPKLFVTLPMQPSDVYTKLPIAENVMFNGKKIKTLFDPGALTVISLTPTAAKEIGLSVPPDKTPPLTNNVSLELEKMSFADLPATVHSKGSSFAQDAQGYGAVVGIAVLQNFIITFDFKDGAITLEKI